MRRSKGSISGRPAVHSARPGHGGSALRHPLRGGAAGPSHLGQAHQVDALDRRQTGRQAAQQVARRCLALRHQRLADHEPRRLLVAAAMGA